MSNPTQDDSAGQRGNDSKQAMLAKFRKENLMNYMPTDSDEESPWATASVPQPSQHATKLDRNSKKIKSKALQHKTPAKPSNNAQQAPLRKSPRIAERKRKVQTGESSGADEGSPSPLAKRVKITKSTKGPRRSSSPAEVSIDKPQVSELKTPQIVGRKRKVQIGESSGADEGSPSPTTKKAKPTKATNSSRSAGSPAPSKPGNLPKSVRPINATTKPEKKIGLEVVSIKPAARLERELTPEAVSLAGPPSSGTRRKGKGKARAVTPDDYDNSPAPEERPRAKKSQTQKDLEDATIAFEKASDPTGMGTSEQKPSFATIDKPWKCANRMCTTGMTWLVREGVRNATGRKVTSHFFGRNKKETSYIHPEVWHWFCRKCYQRNGYQAKPRTEQGSFNTLTKQHIDVLRMQIIRMQLWRPDATFRVQLLKEAKARLAEYHKALQRPGTSEAQAVEEVQFTPEQKANGKETQPKSAYIIPIKSIEHFEYTFSGPTQTYRDLVQICDWIDGLNDNGDVPCDPPIEFLISEELEHETVIDPIGPPDNYERWVRHCDGEGQDSQESEAARSDVEMGSTPAADVESTKDESEDDDDDDDVPAARQPPAQKRSFLTMTELGRQLGLRGTAGIFLGSGIRADREEKQPDDDARSENSEDPKTSRYPETSETPKISEKPETSVKPQTSETPKISEYPDTSKNAKISGNPTTFETSKFSKNSDVEIKTEE